MKKLLLTLSIGTCFVISGCDNHEDDSILETIEYEMLVLPGSPNILDPKVIDGSLSDLKIVSEPSKGDVESIGDNRFIRYTPNLDFNSGDDSFFVDFTNQQNKIVKSKINFKIQETQDCSINTGVFDYIEVKPGESFKIDLLDNDLFCGNKDDDIKSAVVQLIHLDHDYTDPLVQTLTISANLVDNEITLTYDAPEDAEGIINILYRFGVNYDLRNFSYDENGETIFEKNQEYLIAQATIKIVN